MAAGILGPTPLKVKFVPGHSFLGDSEHLSLVRKGSLLFATTPHLL